MPSGIAPDFDLERLGEIPDPLHGRVQRSASPPSPPSVSPSRAEVRGRRGAALGLSMAWVMGNLAVYGLRPDLAALPLGYLAVQVVAPFLLALTALVGALHPGRFGLGFERRIVLGLTLSGPAAFALLAFAGPPLYPAGFRYGGLDGCLMCFNTTLIWAAVPLGLIALALRRAFVSGVPWRAALVGVSCGLLAGGTINLFCPNADPVHVMVGHGVPMLVTTLVGMVLMARWARA